MYICAQEVFWETSSEEEEEEEGRGKDGEQGEGGGGGGVVDVEDIGRVLHRVKIPRAGRGEEVRKRAKMEPREMVTPLLRKNLSKQGV